MCCRSKANRRKRIPGFALVRNSLGIKILRVTDGDGGRKKNFAIKPVF